MTLRPGVHSEAATRASRCPRAGPPHTRLFERLLYHPALVAGHSKMCLQARDSLALAEAPKTRYDLHTVLETPPAALFISVRGPFLPEIFVDADGCPVKKEVYRVARRYGLNVTLVANSWVETPKADWVKLVTVDHGFDAADDWIVEHVTSGDIVVSADIPLAARCLEKDARVLSPAGRLFTDDSIGEALAKRELLSQLRDLGTMTGGPAPFDRRDRSRFLQRLDETIQAVRRRR